jgi:hypothetical protein
MTSSAGPFPENCSIDTNSLFWLCVACRVVLKILLAAEIAAQLAAQLATAWSSLDSQLKS